MNRLFDRILLLAIAVFLGMMALRPWFSPEPVRAAGEPRHLYIEPGTYMLRSPDASRQVVGKVVVDLSTGKIWGFPTLSDSPYPVDTTKSTPPVSSPLYLGRYDFAGVSAE
jgi:hypothetical protein